MKKGLSRLQKFSPDIKINWKREKKAIKPKKQELQRKGREVLQARETRELVL